MIPKVKKEIGSFDFVYDEYNNSAKYDSTKVEKFKCRYCGEKSKSKFNTKSHLLPEFMGNKSIFSFNECDVCNNKFSIYENSLKNFGVLNSYLPIKGKKKYPKHTDSKNKTVTEFTDESTLITHIKDNNAVIYDGANVKLKIASNNFKPLYVHKALTKIAISLLSDEDANDLSVLKEWLIEKDKFHDDESRFDTQLWIYSLIDITCKSLKPSAYLFKRKTQYDSPEYIFILHWGKYKFQIYIPFVPNDIFLHNKCEIKIPISYNLLLKYGYECGDNMKVKFEQVDINSLHTYITETATYHKVDGTLPLPITKSNLNL